MFFGIVGHMEDEVETELYHFDGIPNEVLCVMSGSVGTAVRRVAVGVGF